MHIEKSDELAKWIVKELTPICDAEPEALAKYVIALLKKPDKTTEELKKFSCEQLDVFLGAHTESFVDKIFNTVDSKSYISVKTEPVDEVEKALPEVAKAPLYEHKNEASVSNESKNQAKQAESSNRPVKIEPREERQASSKVVEQNQRPVRKRISPPPPDEREKEKGTEREKDRQNIREIRDRRRSRSPRERRRPVVTKTRASSNDRDRYRRRSRSRSNSRSPNPSHRRSERKRRCKDFEERGFCMRGEQCPYYHGPDPVVVDENALSNMNMGPIPTATPNFSIPPPGYNPMNPPPPGVPIVSGEYNPEAPGLNTVSTYSIPPPSLTGSAAPNQWGGGAPIYNAQPVPYGAPSQQVGPPHGYRGSHIRGRGAGRGGRGGGIGRGGYHGTGNKDGNTLQVAKIPPELNNIAKLNEHFATFGTVDNIQVRYNGEPDSALITFASKGEAIRAHKSPAPVLNNRFIKVFWHKPPEANGVEENGQNGQQPQPTEPPKPVEKQKIATVKEAKFVSAEIQNQRKKIIDGTAKVNSEKANIAKLVVLQNQQNELLDKLMEKQKACLLKARNSTDENEKKTATKLVKQIHKRIKLCKDEIDKILMQISEKSIIIDDTISMVESMKVRAKSNEAGSGDEESANNSRKRKAQDSGDDSSNPKQSSVVVVKNIDESEITGLMAHMEQFGETFGSNVTLEDDSYVAVFSYKRNEDALKALNGGKYLGKTNLKMELKHEPIDDTVSKDTHMTANHLLGALPSDSEDEEVNMNPNPNHFSLGSVENYEP